METTRGPQTLVLSRRRIIVLFEMVRISPGGECKAVTGLKFTSVFPERSIVMERAAKTMDERMKTLIIDAGTEMLRRAA